MCNCDHGGGPFYQRTTPCCHPKFQFPSGWDITHSPKHWSTEETMIRYISNIIIPYVDKVQQLLSDRKPALIIMDNFNNQVTPSVSTLFEDHDIHASLLPANTTDLLQPMDISVNNPDILSRNLKQCGVECPWRFSRTGDSHDFTSNMLLRSVTSGDVQLAAVSCIIAVQLLLLCTNRGK